MVTLLPWKIATHLYIIIKTRAMCSAEVMITTFVQPQKIPTITHDTQFPIRLQNLIYTN